MAHPATSQARHHPAPRLHLPLPQGRQGGDGQDQDAEPADRHQPAAGRPPPPGQLGVVGLVRLLPVRRVARNLRLRQPPRAATRHRMAAPQAPPEHLEGSATARPRRRMVASRGEGEPVRPRSGAHQALPISRRHRYPFTLAEHAMSATTNPVTGPVESPVLCEGHAGFGRRLGETHRWKHRRGAPSRPHPTVPWAKRRRSGPANRLPSCRLGGSCGELGSVG